jgi:peptidyl-dipeptidase Dcp
MRLLPLAAALVVSCAKEPLEEMVSPMPQSPLLAPWEGPFGGLPPFDRVQVAELEPAVRQAMELSTAEFARIATSTEPPTFDNTLAAMERAGAELRRVSTLYHLWTANFSDEEVRAIEGRLEPAYAAYSDRIYQDPQLFARVEAVYQARASLPPEQRRLAEVVRNDFVRAGAALDDDGRARVAAINQELSTLYTEFSNHLLADEEGHALILESEADTAGLPQSFLDAAAEAAKERGRPGVWAVSNTRSMVEPFLTASTRRDLREKVWRSFIHRGDNGDANDNNALVPRILALRAERARLLGYATHAHYSVADGMARTPERAMELMEAVWPAAVARVAEEVADMQAIADAEGAKITIEPWDYWFYAEKVRKARYDLDQNQIKPYLQLEKLREGMFWAAGELYGWQFAPIDAPVPHPDFRAWEVKAADGAHVGVFYFDPFARPGKRSGAWMTHYRQQSGLDGASPIVSNNSNFVKGAPGQPVLISWDDAETLFHEFGHAMHGLASKVTYPTLAGTSVARDFVEFPSQLNERWLATDELLTRFAVHVETGEPMPPALLERIQAASTFNQGYGTTSFLASALVDMKLHLAGDAPIDADAFERDTLGALGMPPQLVMRHRIPQFGHVFSGDGYAAGYYAYLWADTLTADATEAFEETGSLYDAATAKRYHDTVLSIGNTVEPSEAWKAFRGRDVQTDALLRARGFPAPPKAAPAK